MANRASVPCGGAISACRIWCSATSSTIPQPLGTYELKTMLVRDSSEGRACRRPTARKVIDLFEDLQRHTLTSVGPPVVFITALTRLQRKVLRLLDMADAYDF